MRHPRETRPYDENFTPVSSFEDEVENAVYDIHDRYALNEMADKGVKATIYSKSAVGSIAKEEGYVKEVSQHGVTYIPARGRRERMIMTYYSSFWMVVAGWGHPETDRGMVPQASGPDVDVSRSRYRSTDSRWISDFLEGPGKSLKPLAMMFDSKFTNPGKLPEPNPDDVGIR